MNFLYISFLIIVIILSNIMIVYGIIGIIKKYRKKPSEKTKKNKTQDSYNRSEYVKNVKSEYDKSENTSPKSSTKENVKSDNSKTEFIKRDFPKYNDVESVKSQFKNANNDESSSNKKDVSVEENDELIKDINIRISVDPFENTITIRKDINGELLKLTSKEIDAVFRQIKREIMRDDGIVETEA